LERYHEVRGHSHKRLTPVDSNIGFQDARVPTINVPIIKSFVNQLPATVIVLLIEHISIAKSFGRVNGYTINPSQELVAIGVTNLLGPFLGAYPATGSFSRTAIKSKAGVRTPFAGVITGLVVLLAVYALPAVFFYIPNATLSGVIIHAVLDLITPPNTVYQFWKISPFEVFIFLAGVFVTVFSSIENGIYVTISVSAALLFFRIMKARGRFLGQVKVHSVIGDHLLEGGETKKEGGALQRRKQNDPSSVRNIFLPIDHHDGSNPEIAVENPYPGIFIYRFSEGYNYPNTNHYLDNMVATIFKQTRRTDPTTFGKLGVSDHSKDTVSVRNIINNSQDRPWNDPGPRRGKALEIDDHRPTLKAIILDFSSVNNVDITSVQNLIDVRNQLDRWTSPEPVEWHFACITNRWTKRALASAGFGYPTPEHVEGFQRWKPIFSVAEIGGSDSAAAAAEWDENRAELKRQRTRDIEQSRTRSRSRNRESIEQIGSSGNSSDSGHDTLGKTLEESKAFRHTATASKIAVVHGLNRPFFHIDLTSALQSAIANTEARKAELNPHHVTGAEDLGAHVGGLA